MEIEYPNQNKWARIGKMVLTYLGIALAIWFLFVIAKIWFIYDLYMFAVSFVMKGTGLDLLYARPIAVLLSVGVLSSVPYFAAFFIYGGKKRQVLVITTLAVLAYTCGIYLSTENTFFDRTTGKPAKYYIKTLNGFKFSSTEDYDPTFGAKFKPIDKEVVKEYFFWKKTGEYSNIPNVEDGKYFDMLTGEPIVWYANLPDGSIKLFSLPGFDPKTGEQLKPITKDIAGRKISFSTTNKNEILEDFIEHNNGDNDLILKWYLKQPKNVASETNQVSCREGQPFEITIEKIIFYGNFTIVGVAYTTSNSIVVACYDDHLIDTDGRSLRSINKSSTTDISNDTVIINSNEVVRIIHVYKNVSESDLKSGGFGVGSANVKFNLL